MTLADDIDKHPIAGGPVNQPASGTQGDKAEAERLAADLPAPSPGPGGQIPPVPSGGPSSPRSNRNATGLPGIPAPLMMGTNRPNVAVNTPLSTQGGGAPQLTGAQKRLQELDMMANSPDVNEETRAWARLAIRILTE